MDVLLFARNGSGILRYKKYEVIELKPHKRGSLLCSIAEKKNTSGGPAPFPSYWIHPSRLDAQHHEHDGDEQKQQNDEDGALLSRQRRGRASAGHGDCPAPRVKSDSLNPANGVHPVSARTGGVAAREVGARER